MSVHDIAERGFGADAETYERVRPGYPPELMAWFVEHLRLGAGTVVLDLAAGTGKLTRALVPTGARIVAAEPVDPMLAVLRRVLPHVPVVATAAESLPFGDGSFDAVVVAQAFHWFDSDVASSELARSLRPGGRLGLVWNARDRTDSWADEIWALLDRVEKRAPWSGREEWRDAIADGLVGFAPAHAATFHQTVRSAPDAVVERIGSVSHVAVLDDAQRARVLDEARRILATHPDTAGRDLVEMPYRVDAYWCERA